MIYEFSRSVLLKLIKLITIDKVVFVPWYHVIVVLLLPMNLSNPGKIE